MSGRSTSHRFLLSSGILLVLATVWILATRPGYEFDPSDYRPELVSSESFGCAMVLAFGRYAGGLLLVLASFLAGLNSFANERRCGTMEQLVLLPIHRGKLMMRRLIAATAILLPAVVVIAVIDLIMLPGALQKVCAPQAGILIAMVYISIASSALPALIFGMLVSVLGRTRLRTAALLLAGALWVSADIYLHYVTFFEPMWLLLVAAKIIAAGGLLVLLIIKFDRWALGE